MPRLIRFRRFRQITAENALRDLHTGISAPGRSRLFLQHFLQPRQKLLFRGFRAAGAGDSLLAHLISFDAMRSFRQFYIPYHKIQHAQCLSARFRQLAARESPSGPDAENARLAGQNPRSGGVFRLRAGCRISSPDSRSDPAGSQPDRPAAPGPRGRVASSPRRTSRPAATFSDHLPGRTLGRRREKAQPESVRLAALRREERIAAISAAREPRAISAPRS